MTGNDIIARAFAPIAGLPCWQALGEFGTYLTFHFGVPKVDVTEPTESMRHRRLAGVQGEYILRLEAHQWVAFQDGGKVAHSESPRDVIREAAGRLQGQKLIALTLRCEPVGGEFLFDLGGRVAYQIRDPSEETLWTFRTRLDPDPDDVDIISFTATGSASLFTLRGSVDKPRQYVQKTRHYVISGGAMAVQLGAAPSCGPAASAGSSEVRKGSQSVA